VISNSHKTRRILIIDDNEAIHADFRKILSPDISKSVALSLTETQLFGNILDPAEVRPVRFELDSAYQGEEGVEKVKKALEEKRPYAMAFVDMRMPPGWDGLVTTQKIVEIDSHIQIAICTAYSDYTWSELFDKIGANDRLFILKKPFDTAEALQLAQDLTQKWHLSQSAPRNPIQSEVTPGFAAS
jgi:CheY-like chemotaxis protein